MTSYTENSGPEWLTEKLFVPILEKELSLNKTEFSLELVSATPAVGKGENYIAQVTRAQVDVTLKNGTNLKPKHYSFIIKSDVTETTNFLEEWNVNENEVVFYAEIVPKFLELDPTMKLIPRCFLTSVELHNSIFLEDLIPLGYKMPNRYDGLDFVHCKLFFEKLAEYHALTAACYEKHGRFVEQFHESIYTEKTRRIQCSFIDMMYPVFLDIFRKYPNLKPFYEKIKKWEGKLFDTMANLTTTNYDQFNVLNHGDPWINNLLYQYDEHNNPIDLRLIDYQLSAYGSPVQDIIYFFISSPNVEVRETKFDELLHIYHEHLVANLRRYNYAKPIPTLRELHMAVLRKGQIGCLMVMGILAVVLVDANETAPFDEVIADDEQGKHIRYCFYNNPRYLKAAEASLKFLDDRGLFIE